MSSSTSSNVGEVNEAYDGCSRNLAMGVDALVISDEASTVESKTVVHTTTPEVAISMPLASCLRPTFFTVTVGLTKSKFGAHEAVLSQSPVLERMCRGPFQESFERHIDLPDDDPEDFGRALEYLYAKDYNTSDLVGLSLFERLASIYIFAEKYQLEDLKKITVKKFQAPDTFHKTPEMFFVLSQRIYENTPESDIVFHSYFNTHAPIVLRAIAAVVLKDLHAMSEAGGEFARDLFKAQRKAYEDEALSHYTTSMQRSASHDRMQVALKAAQTKLSEINHKYKAGQADHGEFHARCTCCRALVYGS